MNKILAAILTIFCMTHFTVSGQSDKYPFEKAWKKVDSLEQKGLTRSALEVTEEIFTAADQAQSDPQLIKALIHVMKYHDMIEEKSDSLNLVRISKELERAQFPRKHILHSLLGNMYYSYYQHHRWQLYDRTKTNVDLDDFQTWDAVTLFSEAAKHYLASLEGGEQLLEESIGEYAPILLKQKDSEQYRPSLYDLLAHRAIDFFRNTATDLPEPAYRFDLTTEQGLSPLATFITLPLETPDTTSRVYQAIRIFQQILAFHQNDSEPYALIDADLKRLAYAKEKAIGSDKSESYLEALRALERQYPEHPAVADVRYEIARHFAEQANSYRPLETEDHKWDRKTALDICEAVISKFPKTRGATNCEALKAEILNHQLQVNLEEVNLADQPFRMRMSYRNVDKVWFRTIRLTDKLKKKLEKIRYYEQDKRVALLLRESPVDQWNAQVPNDGDFQQHATEIRVPGLGFGEYYLLASDNAKFSFKQHGVTLAQTRVSNLSCLEQTVSRVHHFYLVDRNTGEARAGVQGREFKMDRNDRKYKPTGNVHTTDENGHVQLSNKQAGARYYLQFETNGDQLKTSAFYVNNYRETPPRPHPKVVFFLDRKIYRPGQTIYFKGLAMRQEGQTHEIWTNREVEVKLLDANYQEVSTETYRTNEYGTFHGTFTAPTGGLLGRMQLQTEGGNTDFSVEEYKRPKFEVKIEK